MLDGEKAVKLQPTLIYLICLHLIVQRLSAIGFPAALMPSCKKTRMNLNL